ncbi:putative integral membrane protein conserved region-domain-containing protein [Chytridium lagenaria]|nr:putative integral membrane protein conserved region-domain-containing protein [Chytridium lagenaria]
MDGFGNPGEWFLDGLAVRPTTQDSLPGESLSSLPNAVKRKQNIVSNIASMSGTAVSIVEASLQTTSYLLSRFMGESPPLPAIAVASKAVENTYNSRPPWRNVFAVLKHKTLFVYSSDERLECLDIILLTEFKVDLFPENLRDSELYLRETPIRLRLKGSSSKNGETVSGLYLYTASGSDKEDWLFMLRRASHLPPHADVGALSVHFQDTEPMRHFTDAMVKLKTTVEGLEGAQGHATAWLNALVGRAFVGLHASPKIKDWVIRKLSRKYTRARGTSILGDIVIQDLFVGDSIPILSNPKLLGFSTDGDVNVEVDIDYTGGVMVEAATLATISVSAFEPYVKPLQIPLVVSIKVKRFSARVLIKIKPNVETSRVWVGFYREPGLKLELDVEPIIWNKLIRLQVVNQIIERRIKEALEELVVLPNMDDFGFWPSDGKGGF